MKKTFLIVIPVVIGVVFLVETIFYNLQFSLPDLEFTVPKEEKKMVYNNAKNNSIVNYSCEELKDGVTYDIPYELNFEYPIFRFKGLFTIEEEIMVNGKNIFRNIYTSEDFQKRFVIENICYPKGIGKEIKTRFSFITKKGDLYSWDLNYDSSLITTQTSLKVFIPEKKDDYAAVKAQLML